MSELFFLVLDPGHGEVEIGPAEPAALGPDPAPELTFDVLGCVFGGGCGNRYEGSVARQLLDKGADILVFGPEIMAPNRDAVGFVDRHRLDG